MGLGTWQIDVVIALFHQPPVKLSWRWVTDGSSYHFIPSAIGKIELANGD
jgi:hypothetical protein